MEVTRKMTRGSLEAAERLLQASGGGSVLNTAFIERFNGTMRERLATLKRKCRHAAQCVEGLEKGMYLIGCTYNFCWPVRTVLPKRTSVRGWKVQDFFSWITEYSM